MSEIEGTGDADHGPESALDAINFHLRSIIYQFDCITVHQKKEPCTEAAAYTIPTH